MGTMGQTELVVQPATKGSKGLLEMVSFVFGKGEREEQGGD